MGTQELSVRYQIVNPGREELELETDVRNKPGVSKQSGRNWGRIASGARNRLNIESRIIILDRVRTLN